jgi:hypothetical protein
MKQTSPQFFSFYWSRIVAFVAGIAACAATSGCLLPHAGISKRDQAYQAAISDYSAVFQPGARRAEVEDYLRMKKISFRRLCCVDKETTAFADLVQIGRNHDGWPFCSGTTINVAFVFAGTGLLHPPDPADVLKTIKLFTQAENCL